MATKVAIFGGGMAGLSAAHELVHRGYDVEVYETERALGGKSASQYSTKLPAGTGGRADLPGEHGFRFFPGFYQNVIATLQEIPGVNSTGVTTIPVSKDLTPSNNAGITWKGQFYPFPRRNLGPSWDVFGRMQRLFGAMDFTLTDLSRMAWFRLKYLTSGPKRRATYDAIPWWDFIEGNSPHYSAQMRAFEESIPRTMSAMIAKKDSAKVIGDITMQFLLGYARSQEEDRLLVGPTTVRWIEPWRKYLATLGVTFTLDTALDHFEYTAGSLAITHAVVRTGGVTKKVNATYYLAALPLEDVQPVVSATPSFFGDDSELYNLTLLANSTAWMVGAQFYLKTDYPMVDGHVFYPGAAWGLTSVSQGQFWQKSGKPISAAFGDGSVNGILSVIIADWDTPSPVSGLPAREYTKEDDLLKEVLRQLNQELGGAAGKTIDLSPANVLRSYLDANVTLKGFTPAANRSPLLVHPAGALALRPTAHNKITNLFLAADYVRTSTELATMESANEAARRAVNALLDRDGSTHVRCPIWELQEEPFFDPIKKVDNKRFDDGLKHFMDDFPATLATASPGLLDVIQQALKISPSMFF